MNSKLWLCGFALTTAFSTAAIAQTDTMAEYETPAWPTYMEADENGDGAVGPQEAHEVGILEFNLVDLDNDGVLSQEEYDYAADRVDLEYVRTGYPEFNELDVDNDGFVASAEVEGHSMVEFSELDTDNDGYWSEEEYYSEVMR